MKELSIEQKAKAYDEAKLRMSAAYNSNRCTISFMNEIFPELKESEDEKIRKELLNAFQKSEDSLYMVLTPHRRELFIAWLEKQGKNNKWKPSKNEMDALYSLSYITNKMDDKKDEAITKLYQDLKREFFSGVSYENMFPSSPVNTPIKLEKQGEQTSDKIEPKFHEGDWVVSPNGVYWHIDKISNNRYEVTSNTGKGSGSWNLDTNIYHKFTIQDAKDGDVLVASDDSIFLFKCVIDCGCKYYIALTTDNAIKFNEGLEHYWETSRAVHPATKEQRDLLFQKMKEAGYEWDAEKKKLRKIEQKSADKIEPKFKVGDKIQYLKGCGTIMTIEKIENGEYIFGNNLGHTTIEDGNKWYLVENNTAWSEKDEGMIETIIANIKAICKEGYYIGDVNSNELIYPEQLFNWILSLKDRVQPQPKQKWSEEDESYLNTTIAYLKDAKEFKKTAENCINWLKSLKSQNSWKPSDEQMVAINTAINVLGKGTLNGKQLIELRKELKNLREE